MSKIADVPYGFGNVVNIAVSRMPEMKKGPGRSPVQSQDIVKVMLIQAYFGMPNRIAQGFFRLLGEKLGISSEFSYKTIERG
jgi:transposase